MPKSQAVSLGQRLRYERRRLNWSQQRLAEAVGATSMSINRWEHNRAVPQLHYREQLCRVFNVPADALFDISSGNEDADDPHYAVWNIPLRRNPFFTGRENVLHSLYQTFHATETTPLTQVQAISGLAGVGKTQAAIEYAYRFHNDYSAVLWARADTIDVLTADFLAFAELLKMPEKDEQDQRRVIQAVKQWLTDSANWLLILDNVEDFAMVVEFLPCENKGNILITTRAQSTGTLARRIHLEQMEIDEGSLFLLRRAKLIDPGTLLEDASQELRIPAAKISHLVDGLPLALDQAGAYIEETGCDVLDYLDHYSAQQTILLSRRGSQVVDHPESVYTTFSLSFEKVEQAHPNFAEVLWLCAFLAADAIPEEIIIEGIPEHGPGRPPKTADTLILNDALAILRDYSFLHRNSESKTLTIHRLVQAVLKERMDKHTQRYWAERAVHALSRCFPYANEAIMWPRCQRLYTQAEACIQLIKRWKLVSPEAGRLLNHVGVYLRERGWYTLAEALLNQARDIRLVALGDEHPDVAQSLNDLGSLYGAQGRYSEAEPLHLHALSIREKQLGHDHLDVAHSINDLALIYWYQGRYREAEPLFLRALAILEQRVGPDHSYTITSLNNLAILYHRQGRYGEAELLQKRALAVDEQQLGPENLHTARDLNNLARLYRDQGRYSEAEPLFQRALAILERQVGLENPYAAQSLTNLAVLYQRQGRGSEAEPLFLHALTIREQQLGPENLHTAKSLSNLAVLYREQSKYAEAEALLQKALAIQEQQLGLEHPDTAESLNDLAELRLDQGRYLEGELLCQRALALREKILGDEHPCIAQSLHVLAKLYQAQGKYRQAQSLYQRALDMCEKLLGSEHPDAVKTREHHTRLLSEQQ